MSNPITEAIDDLKFGDIPEEVLQIAFQEDRSKYRFTIKNPKSMDQMIRELIIEDKIRRDLDKIGATEVIIDLSTLIPARYDPFICIYQIPKSLTQGRTIVRPLSVSYGRRSIYGVNSTNMQGASALLDAVGGVMASHGPLPQTGNAYVQLIGENTVYIQDNMSMPTSGWLRCVVTMDPEFTHLNPVSLMSFSELVMWATKAYIYNKMIVRMDRGVVEGGVEIGAYRTVIESYSDAIQNYKDMLKGKFRRVMLFNDGDMKRRHLVSIMGGLN